ncbi:thiamine diphosphokinase [Psychromarinibacter sp. C21-152]|uniref:Thiamine diphosphokinase n=1 Tax=Psychromarinibacter sediminicola TaxID=3033385 RepID=A0AAE3T742_9RHOB|nr:thiamine diphosphokinase [Psychromarinibacter sediminicola]MDF0599960.1 thiamine diphosphokinase [Psychromarinibacter sediminicola]
MTAAFVQSQAPVTLLGGAPVETKRLREALALAPVLVAADSGADRALAVGLTPRAVIGDLDSVTDETRSRLDPATVCEIAEQDSTDFHKALSNIEAPLVLALGFTGARTDHELAAFNVLARRPGGAVIVLGAEDLAFHAPPQVALDLPVGTRVSLFPMAPVTGESTGLRWPIAGLDFAPDGRVGTSNESTGPVRLSFHGPGMLVILPRAHLTPAVRALSPAPPG